MTGEPAIVRPEGPEDADAIAFVVEEAFRSAPHSSRADCVLEGVPQRYFQALSFGRRYAAGTVRYHAAFQVGGA